MCGGLTRTAGLPKPFYTPGAPSRDAARIAHSRGAELASRCFTSIGGQLQHRQKSLAGFPSRRIVPQGGGGGGSNDPSKKKGGR
ncbi:hypothetical protein NDU88_004105 [Pleurodeles waltl]|uniref:Uncharacterized protein n=1 Tax=Pleurodeles waltl TaxID=8319 RepID=A0AAV7T760_PLEWA|nr:hypothetical protein NDU88_004105 [Pleurodeles waltl]